MKVLTTMKVNLAAQTLSRSIADALEFLEKDMKLHTFQGCAATVRFIRRMDRLFDILNSRSPWAKEFKAPLNIDNQDIWRPFIMETIQYLSLCNDVAGRPLWTTPKRTPKVGFIISCWSICGIFDAFVKSGRLNYILTYKCSQDHLEIFFCMVRSRNGWNNNPTALQFSQTFRRLLLHSRISGRGGNCKVMDTTTVLTVPSTTRQKEYLTYDISLFRKASLNTSDYVSHDHDYDVIPDFFDLSEISLNVVTYISGFVLKVLHKMIKCVDCIEGCGSTLEMMQEDPAYKLIFRKNRGGLYIPSLE